MSMPQLYLAISAVSGCLATILGAFGAHGLKGKISEPLFHAYQTGVQYQFYHTFALAIVACLMFRYGASKALSVSAILFIVGMILFSGSLYALAFGAPRWLGPITPVGGLCFIGAWACLTFAALKMN